MPEGFGDVHVVVPRRARREVHEPAEVKDTEELDVQGPEFADVGRV